MKRLSALPPLTRVVLGLIALLGAGTAALLLPGMTVGGGLSWSQALFMAASALSVTGLTVITPGQDLTLAGQFVLLALTQIGGIGFMVGAVAIFELLGRRISLRNRLALTDSLGLLSPANILRLTRLVLAGVLLIEGLGAITLFFNWRAQLGDARALYFAIFHSISAFCNAGFDLFTGLPEYPTGIPTDAVTLVTLGGLIFLGGLGIPVFADLLDRRKPYRLSLNTRLTLWTVALLNVVGALGYFAAEASGSGTLPAEPWTRGLLLSGFQMITTRTGGFWTMADPGALAPATQLLMITWMFIGGAPASMGGGITTGTTVTLAIALASYVRGRTRAEVMGRSLSAESVRRASAVLVISLALVLVSTWLILITHDAPVPVALFEVVSAFATAGLSLGLTGQLNLFGQLLLCVVMIWGRLGALTIIVALARPVQPALASYPEEQILIG
jgi:trk system potassium uptake protein TrkH